MDVREKLVEQAISHFWYGVSHDIFSEPVTTYAKLAIEALEKENGVTVQEWISVKDRLPEDDSDVLAYSRNGEEGRIYPANYAKGVWFDCIFTTPATDTTTHWMPLPSTEGLE